VRASLAHVLRALVALLCAFALWLWVHRDRVSDTSPRLAGILNPR